MHLQQRILVTGGSGFLGSHLCEGLLSHGAEVICLDNFFTGARRNIEPLLNNKRFELIRHDVTFPIYLEIDQIYNLACPASHIDHPPEVSIHAAREGGDARATATASSSGVSIHAAREGGDHTTRASAKIAKVSIHAAREGGDQTRCQTPTPTPSFNPRRPRGRRRLRSGLLPLD